MSTPKITLRPPPNVEFVQGYPGIPPAAPDRPLAGVKGTIEVRVGAQGVKAKWVRVELRKVETLPGGGQGNTFFDYVGQSPVSVWQAQKDEFDILQTQDFPFFIRIPESIPPSIALERNAGIKYELIATVCMKGKKGIFRRAVTPTLSTSTPIVIDKHELHATWPIYSQPDSRHVVTDALTLTVDRSHTCYGPGDRVSVLATLRNDNIITVVLRAFEFMLKETIIFRAGPHVSGKKGAPQVKTSVIGEHKVPVNTTLYGGTQHRVELATILPQGHTTTTVNAARHIDITYTIVVKAILSSGKPLLMELPVAISNWPRSMSIEAVRRIGPTPNLSLLPPHQLHHPHQPEHAPSAQSSASAVRMSPEIRPTSSGSEKHSAPQNVRAEGTLPLPGSHTVPARMGAHQTRPYSIAERVAQHSATGLVGGATASQTISGPVSTATGAGSSRPYDEFGYAQAGGPPPQTSNTSSFQSSRYADPVQAVQASTSRQRSAVAANPGTRLTVANATVDNDDTDEPLNPPPPASSSSRYPTAAEEKRQLQQQLQASSTGSGSAAAAAQSTRPSSPPSPPRSAHTPRRQWPTAEEEKQRLFNAAKAEAERVQSSLGEPLPPTWAASSSSTPQATASGATPPQHKQKQWLTAEEEKQRLFNEAQKAARETQARAAAEDERLQLHNNVREWDRDTRSLRSEGETAHPSYATTVNAYSPPQPFTPPVPHSTQQGPSFDGLTSQSHFPFRNPVNDGLPSKGAQLYQHAMAAMNQPNASLFKTIVPVPAASPLVPPTAAQKAKALSPPQPSAYPSAEVEKAALRYHEAKRAVEQHQHMTGYEEEPSSSTPNDDLVSYDSLYPSKATTSAMGPSTSSRVAHSLSNQSASFLASDSPPITPPPPQAQPSSQFSSAMAEKERLRRRYAEEDAAAISPPPPSELPRASTSESMPPGYGSPPPRSQPLPPVDPNKPRHLTAAEEKAKLKAQYEAEEAAANGAGPSAGPSSAPEYGLPPPPVPYSPQPVQHSTVSVPMRSPSLMHSHSPTSSVSGAHVNRSHTFSHRFEGSISSFTPPRPPPLAPRPPPQYLQEAQEEDALTQADHDTYSDPVVSKLPTSGSPLNLGNGFVDLDLNGIQPSSSRPPLPPKVPLTD